MKKLAYSLCLGLSICFTLTSCADDPVVPAVILGCTDPNSLNYNPDANYPDGNCVYPDKYMPMSVGNEWHLSDVVTIPLAGDVAVNADFIMFGDTTMDGVHYYQMHETITADGFGNIQDGTYLYRQAKTGEIWRTAVGDSIETLFLEYPLDLGTTWYDTPDQTGFYCEVFSNSLVTVPAGSFTAAGVHFNDMSNGSVNDLYFSKDNGLVRVDVEYTLPPPLSTTINMQMELDSYTVNP